MASPFIPHRPRTVPTDVETKAERRELLRHAVAVLAGTAGSATGATIIYPDGTTHYLSRETAEAMTGRISARFRA